MSKVITKMVEMIETKVIVPFSVDVETGKSSPVQGPQLDLHQKLLEEGLMLLVPGDPNSEKIPYKPRG